MANFKIGDIVSRKSYNNDILFKVADIDEAGEDCICTLKALSYRLQADSKESDLTAYRDADTEAKIKNGKGIHIMRSGSKA